MDYANGSLRIGSLFGIEIRLHVLFLIFVGFRLVAGGVDNFAWTALFLIALFGVILLHELGHCFGARWVGGDAPLILLWPLGGLAYARAAQRPWPQFVTVAAGPAVNVILCIIAGAALIIDAGTWQAVWFNPLNAGGVYSATPWVPYVRAFYHLNLFLLAFNLLPIFPLDGGQLFRVLLWKFIGLYRATILACQVGIGGAIFLGVVGFMELQRDGDIPFLMFIALFGGYESYRMLQVAREGFLIEDPPVGARTKRRQGLGSWKKVGDRFRKTRTEQPKTTTSAPQPEADDALSDAERFEAEVDRILKKVSEHGVESLSYIEKQTLQHASRRRGQ